MAIITLDKQQMIYQTVCNLIDAGDMDPGEGVRRFYQAMVNQPLDRVASALLQSSKAKHTALIERMDKAKS